MTVFESLYDVKTERRIRKNSWNEFVKFLQDLSGLSYTKKTAPLISPAVYKDGTTRSNKNVSAWAGWAALDIDAHPFDNNPLFNTMIYKFKLVHCKCWFRI